MSKHTPGPWRCTETQDNVIVNEGGDKWIARALIGNKRSPRFLADPEIAAANATLISASPDMLGALRYVETRCVSEAAYPYASIEDRKMRDMVVAAIAKAEGK